MSKLTEVVHKVEAEYYEFGFVAASKAVQRYLPHLNWEQAQNSVISLVDDGIIVGKSTPKHALVIAPYPGIPPLEEILQRSLPKTTTTTQPQPSTKPDDRPQYPSE